MNKTLAWTLIPLFAAAIDGAAADEKTERQVLERGRYLVKIAGCNDCHTPRYPESGGRVPQADWLVGSTLGFQGPWGTAYAGNLRLYVQSVSEAEWLAGARREMRPPMPWFALRDMSDADMKAIYRFIRSLGPKGEAAPVHVPPGQATATPYIEFVPKNLPPRAGAAM